MRCGSSMDRLSRIQLRAVRLQKCSFTTKKQILNSMLYSKSCPLRSKRIQRLRFDSAGVEHALFIRKGVHRATATHSLQASAQCPYNNPRACGQSSVGGMGHTCFSPTATHTWCAKAKLCLVGFCMRATVQFMRDTCVSSEALQCLLSAGICMNTIQHCRTVTLMLRLCERSRVTALPVVQLFGR